MRNLLYVVLFYLIFGVFYTVHAQSYKKFAIININNIFQKSFARMSSINKIVNEFKGRADELQYIQNNAQQRIQRLEKNISVMSKNNQEKIKKIIQFQNKIFIDKFIKFRKDHIQRQNNEKNKILKLIQASIYDIAHKQNIDVIFDANAVIYSKNIKDITNDTLEKINKN
ncbi:MAG: OmpH family outer membrane protein [Enterobacterales bacterium]